MKCESLFQVARVVVGVVRVVTNYYMVKQAYLKKFTAF